MTSPTLNLEGLIEKMKDLDGVVIRLSTKQAFVFCDQENLRRFKAVFDLVPLIAAGPDMGDFTAPTAQAIIREQWIEMVKNQAEKLL